MGTNLYFDALLVLLVLDDNCLRLVYPLENHTSCDFILSGHLKLCFFTTIISLSKRKHVLTNLKLFIKVKQCFKLNCHF